MSPYVEDHNTTTISSYQNPIIPGFAPDPSVVLVDGTFFLVTSSFHIFPGIPIYASKNLQTWVHIGMYLFTDPSICGLTGTVRECHKSYKPSRLE